MGQIEIPKQKKMLIVFVFLLLIQFVYSQPNNNFGKLNPAKPGSYALAFSGAGGRIAQHAAMMAALLNGTFPGGGNVRHIPEYLSGASSGALSAVMTSAIVETFEKKLPPSQGISFEMYKYLLFHLSNGQIFDDSVAGIAEIFTHNIPAGYVLDTTPFETKLASWLKLMNYKVLGDLYIKTAISVVEQGTGHTWRLWSDDPTYSKLPILDVLMASTALPIAFKPRTIRGLGSRLFIDGGTGIDTLPVVALVERKVDTIIGVVYASALTSGGAHLPFPINHLNILSNALATINDMRVDLFEGAINVLESTNITCYTYIPTLSKVYSTLDFAHEQEEFDAVWQWTMSNAPKLVVKKH